MLQKILLALLLTLSTSSWANQYNYNADVKGMVCAFCAYNVSKNISTLPGVDADSVNVDLKGGHVSFHSSQSVNETKLASVFSDSGFTLSNLRESKLKTPITPSNNKPALELTLDRTKSQKYNSVLEAIGNIVADTSAQLLITAQESDEEPLLKPILMGRQQVIKVRFIPAKTDTIKIQLFTER